MHADPPAVYACLPADRRTELAAEVELHRYFGGIDSTAQAREYARIIAGWKPLPMLTQRRQAAQAQKEAPERPGPRSCRRPRELRSVRRIALKHFTAQMTAGTHRATG